MRTLGFDKFVWNKFEQPNAVEAGPVGVEYMDVRNNPLPPAINKKGLLKSPYILDI